MNWRKSMIGDSLYFLFTQYYSYCLCFIIGGAGCKNHAFLLKLLSKRHKQPSFLPQFHLKKPIFFYKSALNPAFIIFLGLIQNRMKTLNSDEDTELEWIMKRGIRTILEVPTKDQIYDNVSFKLGAFYKRFWQNKFEGLKQSTRKAGEMIALAENMRQITRQDDRMIKICSYAREVNKFQADNYQDWKQYIWADLDKEERSLMNDYVEKLTPPVPKVNEQKLKYEARQKERLFAAYKHMKRGMLLVEVFEKIWTIRQYKKNDKPEDVKRHQRLAAELLNQIKSYHPTFRGYLGNKMGYEEWQEIEQLW